MAEMKHVSFAQKSADGQWLTYKYRDDVDERRGYWSLRSDGNVVYVNPIQVGRDARFDNDQYQGATRTARDVAGTSIQNAATVLTFGGSDRLGMGGNSDPLKGRVQGGVPGLSPEWTKGFRQYLQTNNMTGPGVTQANAAEIATFMRDVMAGQMKGENFDQAAYRAWTEGGRGDDASFAKLYAPSYLDTLVKNVDPPTAALSSFSDPNEADSAIRGPSPDVPRTSFASTATPGGSSLTPGANTPSVPETPGDFDGMPVTPQLLQDYLTSNWQGVFHSFVNSFRDAGAAGHFIQFLNDSMWNYYNQHQGELATQALAGNVPEGDFASFLSKRHIDGVGKIGGDESARMPGFESNDESGTQSLNSAASLDTDLPAVAPSAGVSAGLTRNNNFVDYLTR